VCTFFKKSPNLNTEKKKQQSHQKLTGIQNLMMMMMINFINVSRPHQADDFLFEADQLPQKNLSPWRESNSLIPMH